jgi:hypothetical protein
MTSEDELLAISKVMAGAMLFSHRDHGSRVQRHHDLDDLIAAVNQYKSLFPLPIAPKGFGWRKPPELPEPDVEVLAIFGGSTWTAVYRSASGKWLYNSSEGRWQPDAWTYIPEVP